MATITYVFLALCLVQGIALSYGKGGWDDDDHHDHDHDHDHWEWKKKNWENSDWWRRHKHGEPTDQHWGDWIEHHRRHRLAVLIGAPIGGVVLLVITIVVIVVLVKKCNKRKGEKGRIIYPVAEAAPPAYTVEGEEKKVNPELAFGPAYGPDVVTPPPYTPTAPEKTTPPV